MKTFVGNLQAMRQKKRLSESELEIMLGIWQQEPPVTVRDLHTRLYADGRKAYTTVQTLMNILVDKGFLARRKVGMVNFYTPRVSREEAASAAASSLVSRFFQGSFGALAHHLADSGQLSAEDLNELRSIIEKHDESEPEDVRGGS